MIDLEAAKELIDFSSRIGKGHRAEEQLRGTVAIHNILESNKVAYLADEVGMGKTLVALGVVALFRHFQPAFRVMVIAPRENIQMKWRKEFRNFVRSNLLFHDLRVKTVDGRPARPLVACANLVDLVRESTLDPDRDFFLRLTSFSLPLAGKENVDLEQARSYRDRLKSFLPWLSENVFDLRKKQDFKDNLARAINCALPEFDLLIIDEGHNLKHGLSEHVASRNRVLAFAFGHPEGRTSPDIFRSYGPRAKRVLFLSATPVEETYTHLWNQLHVLGLGGPYEVLKNNDAGEEVKKEAARRFLIRRVTSISVNGETLTKNLYRREWRRGGVIKHDYPIAVSDDSQRLIIALVQKKVAELLGHEHFNSSFQIGMLASFESFLETVKLKKVEDDQGNFDGFEQTDDQLEREGIDVFDINRISRDYRSRFSAEMPHPKMDEVVRALSTCWETGEKSLLFVRRVHSVSELKRKLDEKYNEWLFNRLRNELPQAEAVQLRLEEAIARYQSERRTAYEKPSPSSDGIDFSRPNEEDVNDEGDIDTFFAWFFRGEGPKGIVSGANVQQRFIQRGTTYSTFFDDNHVAAVLGAEPGQVKASLAGYFGISEKALELELSDRAKYFIGKAKKVQRGDRFEAAQAAAIEWLKDTPGKYQDHARIIWYELFEHSRRAIHGVEAPEIGDILETRTFFTELRKRPQLRERLWGESNSTDPSERFRERMLRALLLAAAARLGHSFFDLYIMTIRRLGSLELRAQEDEEERGSGQFERIQEYLSLLEQQMQQSGPDQKWRAFGELSQISQNFSLILDVNAPEVKNKPLPESSRIFGRLLGRQRPIGGMFGQVNPTLVRQFRMPGYPLALITIDLLQEGEDLHTFCSAVHHYGISWTPSSMEQRIGRIDRVLSATDRRLSTLKRPMEGLDKLQVYYPYLPETVEVLQVQRVLERMNTFLRLMHEGLVFSTPEEKKINVNQEILRMIREIPRIENKLKSAFDVRDELLHGDVQKLAVGIEEAENIESRFNKLKGITSEMGEVEWEDYPMPGALYGTAKCGDRRQPFRLELGSIGARPLLRCISPIGIVEVNEKLNIIQELAQKTPVRICASLANDSEQQCELTVEGDVILGCGPDDDSVRAIGMIRRTIYQADQMEKALFEKDDMQMSDFRDKFDQENTGEE